MSTDLAPAPPSNRVAFFALVVFTFRRQWRVRQMGGVALGLLALLTIVVGVITYGSVGWGFPDKYNWRYQAKNRDLPELLDQAQGLPLSPEATGLQLVFYGTYRRILLNKPFLDAWMFLNFSRWVVFTMYLSFLLPLFTLAFGSGAIGSEREGRTLIWLFTRPMPRSAVYLAKLLGVLPWSLLASVGGFVVLTLAGGEVGRRALVAYWPAAVLGTIAFTSLFHLIGALFRRPAVIGLVYIFFFETLVANLPGSLKQLSLNYYVRSLLYNEAITTVTTATPESLEVYAPCDPWTAGLTLMGAAVGLTALGMWLFGRQEPQDES